MIALEAGSMFSDELAVPATYTPYGGQSSQIQLIIIAGVQDRPEFITSNGGVHVLPVERGARSDFRNNTARQVGTVLVKAADVATPKYLDTVEVDGVIWTVKEVFDNV